LNNIFIFKLKFYDIFINIKEKKLN